MFCSYLRTLELSHGIVQTYSNPSPRYLLSTCMVGKVCLFVTCTCNSELRSVRDHVENQRLFLLAPISPFPENSGRWDASTINLYISKNFMPDYLVPYSFLPHFLQCKMGTRKEICILLHILYCEWSKSVISNSRRHVQTSLFLCRTLIYKGINDY